MVNFSVVGRQVASPWISLIYSHRTFIWREPGTSLDMENLADDFLESEDIHRMEWPVRSTIELPVLSRPHPYRACLERSG
ncbi:hypothetical protein TNCV_235851 [Trichonephila clavipes]|nr:hypothetical protein TNCV_235851 [Trichonephila clavipes]